MWITVDKTTLLAVLLLRCLVFLILILAYVSYWVSWMHSEKYKHYLKSHRRLSERQEFITLRSTLPAFEGCGRHLEKRSQIQESSAPTLCYVAWDANLNGALGWEKATSFSTGKENGWALWLCKVGLRVPLRSSSTLRARMGAVLRTDVRFSLRLQGSPCFLWLLREIISFQAGLPETLCRNLRGRMRAGIRIEMKFITSF